MTPAFANIVAERCRAAWQACGRRAGFTPQRVRELCRSLASAKDALDAFSATIENEFLDAGARLRTIAALAPQARERADAVIEIASGRTEDAAVHYAFLLLQKAEDLVRASHHQYATVCQVLEGVHAGLTRIARERDALLRTLFPLEMATTQFRVQACPFDEAIRAQFFSLADSISELVSDIRAAVGRGFEQLETTRQSSRELVLRLAAMSARQKRDAGCMLSGARSNLLALEDALRSSDRAAHCLSGAGARIGHGVGQAIVALQCQDMARQKIQHIGQAIDEMILHVEPGARRRFNRAEENDCRHFLRDAARVQLRQLTAVFGALDEAARTVTGGLGEIEAEGKSSADEALRSGAAALDSQIFGRSAKSIQEILAIIEEALAHVESVTELVRGLKAAFTDCTSGIVGVALRLRLVALNAQIYAANVEAGAALEVVAKSAGEIAGDAMRQLDAISLQIAGLGDSVVNLERTLEDFREISHSDRSVLVAEAECSRNRLLALEAQMRDALDRVAGIGRQLSAATQAAVDRIQFPIAVAAERTRSTAFFERIERECDFGLSRSHLSHHKVAGLKRNYTMDHERKVHERVIHGGEAPDDPGGAGDPEGGSVEPPCRTEASLNRQDRPVEGAAATPRCDTGGGELGGSIELF